MTHLFLIEISYFVVITGFTFYSEMVCRYTETISTFSKMAEIFSIPLAIFFKQKQNRGEFLQNGVKNN